MHGVKRDLNVDPDEQKERNAEELAQVHAYLSAVQAFQAARDKADPEQLWTCTSKLLLLNPEYYTAWNVRKRLLKDAAVSISAEMITTELELSLTALKSNPKSYSAWFHRRWFIQTILAPNHQSINEVFQLSHEFKLCVKLLDLDPRNFHCWNYRKFLAEWFMIEPRVELDFTSQKIYQNFSNYSAWHHRSRLLPLVHKDDLQAAIHSELEMLRSAYFTEPADQSCWFYLRWLLGQVRDNPKELIKTEMAKIDELLELEEENAPMAMLTWINLARTLNESVAQSKDRLQKLTLVDPLRRGYYQDRITI